MADFGTLLNDSLAAAGQAQIDQANALALIGSSAADKALQLARGAVDLLQASGDQQVQAKLDDVETGVLLARKVGAVGIVGATTVGIAATAAVGALDYGRRNNNQRMRAFNNELEQSFVPHRLAGNPCLPCLDQSSGQARRLRNLPPALGQVRGVASKTAEGRDTPLKQQHGIGGVIHGLETRKAGDINRLLAGTGQAGPASDYIGPTLKT